jgi:hypothetical protein
MWGVWPLEDRLQAQLQAVCGAAMGSPRPPRATRAVCLWTGQHRGTVRMRTRGLRARIPERPLEGRLQARLRAVGSVATGSSRPPRATKAVCLRAGPRGMGRSQHRGTALMRTRGLRARMREAVVCRICGSARHRQHAARLGYGLNAHPPGLTLRRAKDRCPTSCTIHRALSRALSFRKLRSMPTMAWGAPCHRHAISHRHVLSRLPAPPRQCGARERQYPMPRVRPRASYRCGSGRCLS